MESIDNLTFASVLTIILGAIVKVAYEYINKRYGQAPEKKRDRDDDSGNGIKTLAEIAIEMRLRVDKLEDDLAEAREINNTLKTLVQVSTQSVEQMIALQLTVARLEKAIAAHVGVSEPPK
jgi:hypothetical protein